MAKKGRPVKGTRAPTRRSRRLRSSSVLPDSTKNVVKQQHVLEKGGSLDQVHANIGPSKGTRAPTRRSQRLRSSSVLPDSTKNVEMEQHVLEKGGSMEQVHANIGPSNDEVTVSAASALDSPQESMEIEEGCTMANEKPVVQIETPASTSTSAVASTSTSAVASTSTSAVASTSTSAVASTSTSAAASNLILAGWNIIYKKTNQDARPKSKTGYNMAFHEPHKYWSIVDEDLTDQLNTAIADGMDPEDFYLTTDEPKVAFKKLKENYIKDKNEFLEKAIKKYLENEKFLVGIKKAINENLEALKGELDPSPNLRQACDEATADYDETIRRLLKHKLINTNSSTGLRRLPKIDWELDETDPKFKRFPKKMKLMLKEAGALKEPDSA